MYGSNKLARSCFCKHSCLKIIPEFQQLLLKHYFCSLETQRFYLENVVSALVMLKLSNGGRFVEIFSKTAIFPHADKQNKHL